MKSRAVVGTFFARHRVATAIAWLVLIVGLGVGAVRLSDNAVDDVTTPGTTSAEGLAVVDESFPEIRNSTALVVFHARRGRVTAIDAERSVRETLDAIGKLQHVVGVVDPFSTQPPTISHDASTALATVHYDAPTRELGPGAARVLERVAARYDTARLRTAVAGELVERTQDIQNNSIAFGLLAAVAILLLLFGSLVATGVTIGTALIGTGVAFAAIRILTSVMDVPVAATAIGVMLGLGVGIDYALFIVSRYREILATGPDRDHNAQIKAVGGAIATSGRAVVVAGTTIVLALLALLLVDIRFLSAMAFSMSLVVALLMATVLTLLPAILGFVRMGVFRLSLPRRGVPDPERAADAATPTKSLWERWSLHVTKHPWPYLLTGLVVLLGLASPLLRLTLGAQTAATVAPRGSDLAVAYELVEQHFGAGIDSPILVVADSERVLANDDKALAELTGRLGQLDKVAAVAPAEFNRGRTVALIKVTPAIDATSPDAAPLIEEIRSDVIPSTLSNENIDSFVTGEIAELVDQDARIDSRILWFIGGVLGIAFLVLAVAFRSLFIPFKAAVMNLLSIGAAYGVLIAVFEWGWGAGLIGVSKTAAIDSVVPLIMFAILFGLSMDYEVFMLSRIREEHALTDDNRIAIARGLGKSARIVTSAAGVMIVVFLAFVGVDSTVVKMTGLGLAVAVAIDATITRMILVPATMTVAGKANWWFPRWLDRAVPDLGLTD